VKCKMKKNPRHEMKSFGSRVTERRRSGSDKLLAVALTFSYKILSAGGKRALTPRGVFMLWGDSEKVSLLLHSRCIVCWPRGVSFLYIYAEMMLSRNNLGLGIIYDAPFKIFK